MWQPMAREENTLSTTTTTTPTITAITTTTTTATTTTHDNNPKDIGDVETKCPGVISGIREWRRPQSGRARLEHTYRYFPTAILSL